MHYRQLGQCGVRVSELGFGGATLGNVYKALDPFPNPEALAAIPAALAPVHTMTWPAGIESPEARALAARWERAWAGA